MSNLDLLTSGHTCGVWLTQPPLVGQQLQVLGNKNTQTNANKQMSRQHMHSYASCCHDNIPDRSRLGRGGPCLWFQFPGFRALRYRGAAAGVGKVVPVSSQEAGDGGALLGVLSPLYSILDAQHMKWHHPHLGSTRLLQLAECKGLTAMPRALFL